jgi:type I restriction enzyme M protein
MSKTNNKEIPLEQALWQIADKLRKNMDAAEYKHIVLGLIFLKYISDSFEEKKVQLEFEYSKPDSKWYIPEPTVRYQAINDADEYRAENVFFVPENARWTYLKKNAKQPNIGKIVDDAMDEIEKQNPTLKGVLPKDYARPSLDKQSLGGLIDLISTIALGDTKSQAKDILGRIYEYFLGQFAAAEGKKGGQFYTPESIVRLLVAMIEPYHGRVYDPCCGSGGMFVQSEKFIIAHQGKINDISIFGQESNSTTYKLCRMNLALRSIDGSNIKWNNEGSFLNDANKDLKADFVIANPPFNDSDWSGDQLRTDARWQYGVPPTGNANFAWVQHFIFHLAPAGVAGFVLSNGSLSSETSNEGEIRKNMIEANLVDCIVAMPDKLFYNTGIPACLWFLSRDRSNHKFRDRKNEVLFIDARSFGTMIDRKHRILTDTDISKISDTFHNWRNKEGNYEDIKGYCKSATLDEIRRQNCVLTPGRYVGVPDEEEDLEKFDEKMKSLTRELAEQMKLGLELDEKIKKNLMGIGYDV